MKIYLIGLPGSGKTTLGKQLAAQLKIDFVDLDTEIEKSEKRAIAVIFKEAGEDYFRSSEATELRKWSRAQNNFVMATGGGARVFLTIWN
jgi:shikimate kinase